MVLVLGIGVQDKNYHLVGRSLGVRVESVQNNAVLGGSKDAGGHLKELEKVWFCLQMRNRGCACLGSWRCFCRRQHRIIPAFGH